MRSKEQQCSPDCPSEVSPLWVGSSWRGKCPPAVGNSLQAFKTCCRFPRSRNQSLLLFIQSQLFPHLPQIWSDAFGSFVAVAHVLSVVRVLSQAGGHWVPLGQGVRQQPGTLPDEANLCYTFCVLSLFGFPLYLMLLWERLQFQDLCLMVDPSRKVRCSIAALLLFICVAK